MLHVASLRKRGTMGQVVHSATKHAGIGKCEVAKAELARLQEAMAKMRTESSNEIESLRARIEELNESRKADRQNTSKEKQIPADAEKEAPVSASPASLAELTSRIEETDRQINDLTRELQSSNETQAKYKKRLDELRAGGRKVPATKVVRELTTKVSNERRRNMELSEKLTRLRMIAVGRGELIRRLHTQAHGKQKTQLRQRKRLLVKIAEISSKLKQAGSEDARTIESLNTNLASLNANLVELDNEGRKHIEESTRLSALLDRTIEENQNLAASLKSEIESHTRDLHELKSEAQSNEAATNELHKEKAALQAKLDEETNKSKKLATEVHNLKSSESNNNKTIAELKTIFQNKEQTIAELNEMIAVIDANILANAQKAQRMHELVDETGRREKQLQDHLSEAEQKLSESEEYTKQLTNELSSAKITIQTQVTEISRALKSADAIKKKASELDKRKAELENENNELNLKLASLQMDLDNTKAYLKSAGSKNAEDRDALEKKARTLQETIATLHAHISERDARISSLQREREVTIESHTESTALLESRIQGLTENLTEAQESNTDIQTKLKESETHVAHIADKLDGTKSAIERLDGKLDELEKTKANLEKEIAESKTELQAERTKSESRKATSDADIDKLTASVTQKESRIAELEGKLRETKVVIQRYAEDIKGKHEILKNEARKQALYTKGIHEQIDDARSLLASCKSENEKLINQISVASAEYQKDLTELRSQLQQSRDLYGKAKESNDTLISENGNLHATLNSRNMQLSEMQALHAIEKSEISKKGTKEVDDLQKEIHSLTNKITELSSLKLRVDETEKRLNSQIELNNDLTKRAEEAEAKIRELEHKVSELTGTLSSIKEIAQCKDDDVVACIKDRISENKKIADDLKQCESRATDITKNNDDLMFRLSAMNKEIEDKTNSIKEANKKIEVVQSRLSEVTELNSEKTKQTTNELEELNAQKAELRRKLDEAKRKQSELKAEAEDAAARAKKEIADTRSAMDEMKRKQNDNESEITRATGQLSEKESELVESRKQLADLQKRLSDEGTSSRDLKGVIGTKEAENRKLADEITRLKSQVESLAKSKEIADESTRNVESQYDRLKNTLDEINEALGINEINEEPGEHASNPVSIAADLKRQNTDKERTLIALAAAASCTSTNADQLVTCIGQSINVSNVVKETIGIKPNDNAESIRRRINELKNKKDEAAIEASLMSKHNTALRASNASKDKQIEELRQNYYECTRAMEYTTKDHNVKMSEADKLIQRLEYKAIADKNTLMELEQSIRVKEQELVRKGDGIRELQKKISIIREEKNETDRKNEELSYLNSDLESSLGSFKDQLASAMRNARETEELTRELAAETDRKEELMSEIEQLKYQAEKTKSLCLLGLIKRETPIIDLSIPVALWETAGELISHYERTISGTRSGTLNAFNLIQRSVREYIKRGISSALSRLHSAHLPQDQDHETPVTEVNQPSPLDAGSTSTRSLGGSATEGSTELNKEDRRNIKDIKTNLNKYVDSTPIMKKMPSHTIALSMRRITGTLISMASVYMSQTEHDALQRKLRLITKTAESDMRLKIQTILNKAFDAATGKDTDQPMDDIVTWGGAILGETDIIPISLPTLELETAVWLNAADSFQDASPVQKAKVHELDSKLANLEKIENAEDATEPSEAVRKLRLELVASLSTTLSKIIPNKSTRLLRYMLLLLYMIRMDTEGGDKELYESADVILKGLLNGTDTREGSSPQDEDTNVYVEITKGLNSSTISQITDLTNQILRAMNGNNNGASDDADDTHEISLLSEIRTIYDENEALNKTEAEFRNRSRPVTPIYARASGFGAYV